jgi:hypothetical protein
MYFAATPSKGETAVVAAALAASELAVEMEEQRLKLVGKAVHGAVDLLMQ